MVVRTEACAVASWPSTTNGTKNYSKAGVTTARTRNLVSITPNRTVAEAMKLMTEKRCRHLPVFKDGQLDGILSIGDLVKTIIAGQSFEIQFLQEYIAGR